MASLKSVLALLIMLVNFFVSESVILEAIRHQSVVLDRWRENWQYTVSHMDSQSARFYQKHHCTIADERHIREHMDDAFSTWVNVFVKCKGIEEGLLSVGVCDPYCRNGLRACEVIRHMDNVPIFRRETIKDRLGNSHIVQVPVACKCRLRETYERSEICSYSARIGLTFRRDS